MAVIAFFILDPNRHIATLTYKPLMVACILNMLIGQMLFQANNRFIELLGGILIRSSKVFGAAFITLTIYLMSTIQKH
ncbi:hypothetical protein C8K61_11152 [Pseudomonas sp. GV071]|nr:hypothetical protein C8K61_11152 [Pseudomonas sp. GV071]